MSAKAGTFEQVQTGTSWTGGWIAAALLAVVIAVTLFAMTRASGPAEPVSQTARFEVSDQLSGGPSRVGTNVIPAPPAQTGIQIGNDTICHQCR
jgi:hypothetical protein